MVEYSYEGVDKSGKRVNGTIDCASDGEVRISLRNQGVRPTKISKAGMLNKDIGSMLGAGSIGLSDLILFTRQMQVLIASGVPLIQGLEIFGEQATKASMQILIRDIREKISSGSFFWETLNMHPKVFSRLYVALIRAGEASGSLDQMLKRVARYLEDLDRIRKLVKGAMFYPVAVVCVGIGVVALLLVFVIPKFEALLVTSGQSLPALTQYVINLSKFMVNNIIAIVVITSATIYGLIKGIKDPRGKALIDRILIKAPLFGPLTQKAGVARFCRTLQTLLSSGVNLVDAVDICKAAVDNAVLEESVARIRPEIEEGRTLGQVMGKMAVFPKMAVQMIGVGESTGNLDAMLEKVADFYEQEVEAIVGGLTKMIEPLILVVLGGAVGTLLIAMYLPIFQLAGSAGGP